MSQPKYTAPSKPGGRLLQTWHRLLQALSQPKYTAPASLVAAYSEPGAAYSKPCPSPSTRPPASLVPLTPNLVPPTPKPCPSPSTRPPAKPAQVHGPQQSLVAAYSKPCGQLPNQSHASLHALTKHPPQSTVLRNHHTPRFRYLSTKWPRFATQPINPIDPHSRVPDAGNPQRVLS